MSDMTDLTTAGMTEDKVGHGDQAGARRGPSRVAAPVSLRTRLWYSPLPTILMGALGILAALAVWELLIEVGMLSVFDVPHPDDVLRKLVWLMGTSAFWSNVGQTFAHAGTGMAIAVMIAVPLGILMGTVEVVRVAFGTIMELLRPVPGVALIPLGMIIWGPVGASVVFIVAFGGTWLLTVQTMHGARAVDEVAVMTARSFGIGRFDRVRWVLIPGSLPYIATGLRICAGVAMVVAVGGELIIGTPGLGTAIRQAQEQLALPTMYALIIASGLLGIAINFAFGRLERWMLGWHPSQRKQELA